MTRIIRAIRFEQRFGLRIGKQTASLIRNAIQMNLLQKIGGHRLFHELQLVLMEQDPSPAIRRMGEFGILSLLSPEMRFDLQLETFLGQLKEVISWHRLSFIDEALQNWWVYLLGLGDRLGRQAAGEFYERLELPENIGARLLWGLTQGDQLLKGFFQLRDPRPSDIYRALQPLKSEELLFLMAKTQREDVRKVVSSYFHKYRDVRTKLKGRDLRAHLISVHRVQKLTWAKSPFRVPSRYDLFHGDGHVPVLRGAQRSAPAAVAPARQRTRVPRAGEHQGQDRGPRRAPHGPSSSSR